MNKKHNVGRELITGYIVVFSAMCNGSESAQQRNFYLDVITEYQVQTFKRSIEDAKVFSLSVLPVWYQRDWWVSVDATWYKSDSTQFLSDKRLHNVGDNITSLCERYALASPAVQAEILERYPNLVTICQQIDNAVNGAQSDSVSGWGDTSVYFGYDYALNSSNCYLSGLLGYKLDDGDEQKLLGTGTQELIGGVTLSVDSSRTKMQLSVDYTHIVGGRWAKFYDDFASASTTMQYKAASDFWVGGGLDWQQAIATFSEHTDDTLNGRLFARWAITKDVQIGFEYSDYLEGEVNIDGQYSASVLMGF